MARFPYCTKVTLIPSSAYSHAIRVWKISKRPLKFSTNPTIVFVYVCYCTSNCYINNAQTNVQYNCQYTKWCYFDVTLQHIRTIVVIQIRRRIFSSYEVLFPRGCYLIDDFGTSIGCSTTRRSKACPVQLVVLRHIHANLQFTQSSESPANWQRYCRHYPNTDSIFHWYHWHESRVTLLVSYVLFDIFRFTHQTHVQHSPLIIF